MPASRLTYICLLALSVSVVVADGSSLGGVFVFDDRRLLVENPASTALELSPRTLFMFGGDSSVAAGRPLVAASFMLNLLFDRGPERDPLGYHVFNLALHVACACLAFLLLRRTLTQLPALAPRSTALAFTSVLLWALHPLHTAAVTYIAQRAELLMSAFLLLTLYASTRALSDASARRWHVAAVSSCFACTLCKEVAVVVPVLVLLYDRTFFTATFRRALAQRAFFYGALLGTWPLIAAIVWLGPRSGTVGLSMDGLRPLNYLLTQCNALVHYVRLVLWPDRLVFDYGWPVVPVDGVQDLLAQAPHYLPSLLVVVAAATAGAWLLVRRHPLGFVLGSFFLILAPSSSIVPISTEIMAEHRMYLPSLVLIAAFVALADLGLSRAERTFPLSPRAWRTLRAACAACIALALALCTDAQNQLYRADELLWASNLIATPDNPRVLVNLGRVLRAKGQPEVASALFEHAVRAAQAIERPKHAMLGIALEDAATTQLAAGNFEQASVNLQRALALSPGRTDLARQLAAALARSGRPEQAIDVLQAAIARDPSELPLRADLLVQMLSLGQRERARAVLRSWSPATVSASDIDSQLAEIARRMNRSPLTR